MDDSVFPKELIEEVALDNGLTLRLFDRSRRVAGDRWYVGLLAEIEVPVDRKELLKCHTGPEKDIDEFISETKGVVIFQMKRERNFIDEKEREEVLKGLLQALKASCLGYMGHGSFGPGFVRRRFQDYLEKRNWWKE